MEKTPELFIPIASQEELADARSWINTTFQWHQVWQDNLCQRIGEAIAAWAEIESDLLILYLRVIKPRDGDAAIHAWDSLQSPRARLDITNAAVLAAQLKPEDFTSWATIYGRLLKKLKRRNLVAHGRIYYDHHGKAPERKMFIASSQTSRGLDERLYPSELIVLRQKFQELARSISTFREAHFR